MAISFARAGVSGIAIGARSTNALEEVEKAVINAAGQKDTKGSPRVLRLTLDVTDEASVNAAARSAKETFGRLDILINNAGYLELFKEIAQTVVSEWWKSWEVNIKGTYLVTRALLPLLLDSENGQKTIVNVSSIGAHVMLHGASGYQVSSFIDSRHLVAPELNQNIYPRPINLRP